MAFSTGHDMKYEFRFGDGLGKLYIAFAIIWSTLLAFGITFIIINRKLSFLRIRSVPVVVSTVAILHVYWVLCLLAYGLNGFFPCGTEFWIMNIYLPIGIALFHLSNTKLLEVAVLQRQYTNDDWATGTRTVQTSPGLAGRRLALGFRNIGAYQKAKWLIGVGMLIQVSLAPTLLNVLLIDIDKFLCALLIFLISRKFHSSFGLVGDYFLDTPAAKKDCRKGWEWILSIVWQFFWSWGYAPYLLWKVRDIRDTHGWRLQTLICCLAGFVPSILLIEAFTIFLPCWYVIRHRRIKNETLEIISQWEQEKYGGVLRSEQEHTMQSPQRILTRTSIRGTNTMRKAHSHMYTMAALEKALHTNSTPLLLFAALKDFSGENIGFLTHVRDWKKEWLLHANMRCENRDAFDSRFSHQQYVKAVEIFCSFVSPRYSDFPINISYSHFQELEAVFHESALKLHGHVAEISNSVTPFEGLDASSDGWGASRMGDSSSSVTSTAFDTGSNFTEKELISHSKESAVVNVYRVKELRDTPTQDFSVPPGFTPEIFDHAADSVRYMVLTNTWPKFVDAGYAASVDKGTAIERFQDRLVECGIGRSRICSF